MKNGIDYFPLDVVLDDKFDLIEAEFGMNGFAVVVKLLQKIYGGNGYFCAWNHEVALLFAKKACFQLSVQQVCKIVNACVERGIFHHGMFDTYGILTSAGIQKRYFEAASRRKSLEADSRFLLISIKKYTKSAGIVIVNEGNEKKNAGISAKNVDILSKNADSSKQSKGEESKEEKSRVKKSRGGGTNTAKSSCNDPGKARKAPRAQKTASVCQKDADSGMDNGGGTEDGGVADKCPDSCDGGNFESGWDRDNGLTDSGSPADSLDEKPEHDESGCFETRRLTAIEQDCEDIGVACRRDAVDLNSSGEIAKDCAFGEFNRVRLTPEEAQRLKDRLGPAAADEYIARLDSYIEGTGKKYKRHYAVILRWFREDQDKKQKGGGAPKCRGPVQEYDFDKLEDLAMRKLLRDSLKEDVT